MNPGGRLVLAGMLDPQNNAVADAFGTWFDIVAAQRRDEWIRLDGIRRS
ncbi:MAG: 50S ribosomal protein L11 methyltransferase [Gammaproteobacteria bacterium]